MDLQGGVKLRCESDGKARRPGGVAGWLLERFRAARREDPKLALLEKIALGPRQSLALVEAGGRRILVATSAEGTPAFYALERQVRVNGRGHEAATVDRRARVSW